MACFCSFHELKCNNSRVNYFLRQPPEGNPGTLMLPSTGRALHCCSLPDWTLTLKRAASLMADSSLHLIYISLQSPHRRSLSSPLSYPSYVSTVHLTQLGNSLPAPVAQPHAHRLGTSPPSSATSVALRSFDLVFIFEQSFSESKPRRNPAPWRIRRSPSTLHWQRELPHSTKTRHLLPTGHPRSQPDLHHHLLQTAHKLASTAQMQRSLQHQRPQLGQPGAILLPSLAETRKPP